MKYIRVILSLLFIHPCFSWSMHKAPEGSPIAPNYSSSNRLIDVGQDKAVINDIMCKLKRIKEYKFLTDPLKNGKMFRFLVRLVRVLEHKKELNRGIIFSILASKKWKEQEKQDCLKIFIALLDGLFEKGYTQKFINYMDAPIFKFGDKKIKIKTSPLLLALDLGYLDIAEFLITKKACLLVWDERKESVYHKIIRISQKRKEDKKVYELQCLINRCLKRYSQQERVRFLNGASLPYAQYSVSPKSSSVGVQTEFVTRENDCKTGRKRARDEEDDYRQRREHRREKRRRPSHYREDTAKTSPGAGRSSLY